MIGPNTWSFSKLFYAIICRIIILSVKAYILIGPNTYLFKNSKNNVQNRLNCIYQYDIVMSLSKDNVGGGGINPCHTATKDHSGLSNIRFYLIFLTFGGKLNK